METVHGVIDLYVQNPMYVTFRFPNSDVWSLVYGGHHVGPNLQRIKDIKYGNYYTSGAHMDTLLGDIELPRTYLIWHAKYAIKSYKQQLDTFLKKHPRVTRTVQGEVKKLETFLEEISLRVISSEGGIRQKIAARSIQRAFRRAIENPAYRMCKNRLLREFKELAD